MSANGIQETGGYSVSNGDPSDFEILSHPSSTSAGQLPVSFGQINPIGLSAMPMSLTDISLEQALARVHDLSRENNDLRDYLKENNEMITKQYDELLAWKNKVHDANVQNREKFEQTKALILGLRKDNEELLEKVRELENSKEDKMNELLGKIQSLETARLLSEKMASELRKQIEDKGMSVEDMDLNLQETVVVSVSAETEERISQLENDLVEKNHMILKLTNDISQLNLNVEQFRGSTDQLLKDVETLQKIKDDLQVENQQLHDKNNDLHLRMQDFLVDTRHSINLLDRDSNSSRSHVSSTDHSSGSKADSEPAEVTRLMEQLHRNEEKFKNELAALRVDLQAEKSKNEQLQSRIHEGSMKLQSYNRQHEQEMNVLQKEHEQRLQEIRQQLEREKESQLQAAPNENDIMSLRSQVLTLISEVHETQTKLSAATDTLDKKDKRLKELEERTSKTHMDMTKQKYDSQAFISSLQQRLTLAEQSFTQERHAHESTKRNMVDLRKSFERLVNDYREMLDTFEQYKKQQEQQAQASMAPDQKAISERLNFLAAQKMAAEEAVAARDHQIFALKEEVKNLKQNYEDMSAVYQAQADVYKADFDAERAAREKQVSEKERILSEMNDLQLQNQRLIDDLDNYSRRQISEMQRRVAPSHFNLQVAGPGGPFGPPQGHYNYPAGGVPDTLHSNDSTFAETFNLDQHQNQAQSLPRVSEGGQQEENDVLSCPQCNLPCPDIDTLQIHVIECLDQHEKRGGPPQGSR